MSNNLEVANAPATPQQRQSALMMMANRLTVDPNKLLATLKDTVFKGATENELLALVVVANAYNLNPLLKQVYAFPAKGGGIVPIVSIDGWIAIVNDHPQYDGIEFQEVMGPNKPESITAIIYRKDRTRPIKVTEFYDECYRNTDPWNKSPRRMLRHKALIQCARVAFGFSGIHDDDDAIDIQSSVTTDAKTPVSGMPANMLPPPTPVSAKPVAPKPAGDAAVKPANVEEPKKELPRCRYCGDKVEDMASHNCQQMRDVTAPKTKPEPKPEPESTSEGEAEAPPSSEAATKPAEAVAPEGFVPMKENYDSDAVNSVALLANRSFITEKQLMDFLRSQKPPLARADQASITELAESKLLKIGNTWADILPKIRAMVG